ncbi:MAG: SDR family oxidoreductase [Nitrososphaeraceae archaeon]
MEEKGVAIITGSSSGIGFETSILLARNGFITYATMRNLDKSSRLSEIVNKENLDMKILRLDVTDDNSVRESIDKIISETKRIDILVNNAGFAIFGAMEETSLDEMKEQFETNFFGSVRTIQAVLPTMKKQKKGKIINVSSMVGRFGVPFNSLYVSSKFALEGLSESLRYELHNYGIDVILVEPGIIKSEFFKNIKISNKSGSHSSYSNLLQNRLKGIESMLKTKSSSPSTVARSILNIINSNISDIRYAVGEDAVFMTNLKKNLTDEEF